MKYWKMKRKKGLIELKCPRCGKKKSKLYLGKFSKVKCPFCENVSKYRKKDIKKFRKKKTEWRIKTWWRKGKELVK